MQLGQQNNNELWLDAVFLLSSYVVFFATVEIGGWLVSLSSLHISQLSSLAILAISAIVALLVCRRVKGDKHYGLNHDLIQNTRTDVVSSRFYLRRITNQVSL